MRRSSANSVVTTTCLLALLLAVPACGNEEPAPDPATGGGGGSSAGKGGGGGSAGLSGKAGATAGKGESGSGGSGTAGASSGGKSGSDGGAGEGGSSDGAAGGGAAAGSGGVAGGAGGTGGNVSGCGLPELDSDEVERPDGELGGLRVLDWAGFRAAVSYTFDDANSSQIEHYAALNALGVPFTFYLVTDKPEAASETWATAVRDGHELGNHTQTHPYDATAEEVDGATEFLETSFGVKVWTMAAPFGDDSYVSFAEERFLINRGAYDGLILPGDDEADPFNLPCFVPDEEAPASDFDEKVDAARADGGWQMLLVHGFTGGDDAAFQPVAIEEFVASIEYAKSLEDVWLDTVVAVGSYFRGQKAFAEAEPVTASDGIRYAWELPENFPPGQCLRVTLTGGTLEQDGRPVPWNERGYYEISLDAESLTISP
jgi:peptidoglycan/xylan/chitin deacetylase (PgdA/CDA1 family)